MKYSKQGVVEGVNWMWYFNEGAFLWGTLSGYVMAQLGRFVHNDPESSRIRTLYRSEECGTITGMELINRNKYDPKELVVASFIDDGNSLINVYRHGVTLDVIEDSGIKHISYLDSVSAGDSDYLIICK